MTVALGSLWYDHPYNLTGCLAEAIWHDKWTVCWLRWALCVCVALCTDWPVGGEGGPVSSRRRLCTTVRQPRGLWHTHTNTHTKRFLKINIPRLKHTLVVTVCVADPKAYLLCIVALVYVFVGLPAALSLSPFVWFMYRLISSFTEVLTHLW